MITELHKKSSLFSLLYKIDKDLAQETQASGCLYCRGPLYNAPYDRKPRGESVKIPEKNKKRLSLCCGSEGCRKRVLPPSCLFMGRRVYWGLVILVVMTIRQTRPEGALTSKLIKKFGLSRKTLFRWISYYRDIFPASSQWQSIRGRVSMHVTNNLLPGSLVEYFIDHSESEEKGIIGCLKFLATGSCDI